MDKLTFYQFIDSLHILVSQFEEAYYDNDLEGIDRTASETPIELTSTEWLKLFAKWLGLEKIINA